MEDWRLEDEATRRHAVAGVTKRLPCDGKSKCQAGPRDKMPTKARPGGLRGDVMASA